MSKELVGGNGYTVGSESYFKYINNYNLVGSWMSDATKTDYKGALEGLSSTINKVMEQIYNDLNKDGPIMMYISSDKRKNLLQCINGFESICKMVNRSNTRASECKKILELTASVTKTLSKETESKILEAVRKVRQKGSSGKSTLERAVNRGIDSITSNVDKIWLAQEILQGRSVLFLADVLRKLNYDTNSSMYKGSNGYTACSYEYIKNIEKQIFGNIAFSKLSGYYSTYAEKIKAALSNIGTTIKADLDTGKRMNDYIQSASAKRLRVFGVELAKVGITIYNFKNKVDLLDWFIGGSITAIIKFQKAYNTIRFGSLLMEDGVYGAKTDGEVSSFIGYVTTVLAPMMDDLVKALSSSKWKSTAIASNKYKILAEKSGKIVTNLGYILYVLEALQIVKNDISDSNTSVERSTVVRLGGIITDFTATLLATMAAAKAVALIGTVTVINPLVGGAIVAATALATSIASRKVGEDFLNERPELVDEIIEKLNKFEVKLS
ncbi:hypothetical protein [Chakrabartyella piscis]|uniref:hypothetical protein n=1 Tax=Chakrabartyella piscis TaxID=2918914 RepID=UPI00295880D1|nr:hypothetical protein [Chakrabartyella piscis]